MNYTMLLGYFSPIFLMRLCNKLLLQLCVCISSRLNLGLIRLKQQQKKHNFLLPPYHRTKGRELKFGELMAYKF